MLENPKFVLLPETVIDELHEASKGRCACSLHDHGHSTRCGRVIERSAYGTAWHVLDLVPDPRLTSEYAVLCEECAAYWIRIGAAAAAPSEDCST